MSRKCVADGLYVQTDVWGNCINVTTDGPKPSPEVIGRLKAAVHDGLSAEAKRAVTRINTPAGDQHVLELKLCGYGSVPIEKVEAQVRNVLDEALA